VIETPTCAGTPSPKVNIDLCVTPRSRRSSKNSEQFGKYLLKIVELSRLVMGIMHRRLKLIYDVYGITARL